MTQWLLLRRLRGPAFLLLLGITALLNQWDILGFGRSWPLYLILAGILTLAERAALAQANLESFDPVTGLPRQQDIPGYAASASAPHSSSIVPSTSPSSSDPDSTGGRL